jgi:hypothetical protein
LRQLGQDFLVLVASWPDKKCFGFAGSQLSFNFSLADVNKAMTKVMESYLAAHGQKLPQDQKSQTELADQIFAAAGPVILAS